MLPSWVERDELEWPQRRQETGSTPVQSTPASTSTQASTTTTTTSSTAPTSTSTTTISTTSTSATSQTTSATISTTSAAPTSAPSSSSTTSRILSTRPDGGVVTLTSTVIGSAPSQTSSGGGGGGFFQNTAAVAAVFTIAGVIGLVLLFVLVTTCLRRRRERKFDRDVAEAAAAAAASNADPFFGDEDDRGAHWDPRRGSAQASGYGRIGEDPYAAYAAPAAAAAAGGAGFGRSATMHYQQQRNPQDAYSMNDMGSSGHPSSGYSNYNPSGNSYYIDQPQVDYSRPSFGSGVVPGIAGVGSGGAMAVAGAQQQQYNQDNQNLRYRGQQQSSVGAAEDPYGGYTTVGATSDGDRYPNPYATPPASTAYSLSPNRRSTNVSPPLPPVPPSQSPPPPPSYTGHGPTLPEKARPLSASHNAPLMPGPSQPHALGPGTPDESYNDGGRILRVANE